MYHYYVYLSRTTCYCLLYHNTLNCPCTSQLILKNPISNPYNIIIILLRWLTQLQQRNITYLNTIFVHRLAITSTCPVMAPRCSAVWRCVENGENAPLEYFRQYDIILLFKSAYLVSVRYESTTRLFPDKSSNSSDKKICIKKTESTWHYENYSVVLTAFWCSRSGPGRTF
jgi:hypothetical protein